jgi:hypothetical protein
MRINNMKLNTKIILISLAIPAILAIATNRETLTIILVIMATIAGSSPDILLATILILITTPLIAKITKLPKATAVAVSATLILTTYIVGLKQLGIETGYAQTYTTITIKGLANIIIAIGLKLLIDKWYNHNQAKKGQ